MTPFVRDLLWLVVGAGAPAGLALLFLRTRPRRGSPFWMAVWQALFALFGLAFVTTIVLMGASERALAACKLAGVGAAACEGGEQMVYALPLWAAVMLFFIGAMIQRVTTRRPSAEQAQGE
jgi:membrane protein YqaA with SNARE-associated domain